MKCTRNYRLYITAAIAYDMGVFRRGKELLLVSCHKLSISIRDRLGKMSESGMVEGHDNGLQGEELTV